MRVVLDVGTSLAWCRPPVGIVRAEQKFAAFLLAHHPADTIFCRFDREGGCHREVSADVVRGRLAGDLEVPAQRPSPSSDAIPFRKRAGRSVASAAQRWIGRLPPTIRPEATLVAERGEAFVKSVYWLGRKTVRDDARSPMSPLARPTAAPERALSIGPGDVYVSMGLDWDYNDVASLHRLKRARGFHAILYCHDLVPIRFPHLMSFDSRDAFAQYFVDVAHAADHVVAVSRASRDDYTEFLATVGAPVPPMSVIHNGSDVTTGERGRGRPPRPELADEPFVLCVGTIEARKNHMLLYHLWERLVARHGARTPRLVLVGMVGWGVGDLLWRMRANPAVAPRIMLLDDVADDELLWLYEHCRFTVYPSFVEGWGLPVVESLALGKPCLTSNAPALLEATGGIVPALDPLDFPAWLQHVERWAFDEQVLRAETEAVRGFRPESWDDHGTALLALARAVAAAPLACASSI